MSDQPDMMSNTERLAYMANRIACNLAIEGPEQAARSTAEHIVKFWESRMIARFFAALETSDMGLNDIARAAVAILREKPRVKAAIAAGR
ncbi:MAG TPA: formate dehydrogenase subunit delta [Sphingomonadaceae bacterium]|nr:formate dehydrogenase subunit delta [Sphingomonadaceae bacterium]